jgi:hypothetical protein
MALSGVAGPFKGAYTIFEAVAGPIATTDNTANTRFWQWSVPAGSGIVVVNVQVYAKAQGVPQMTVDLMDETTSVLSGAISVLTTSTAAGTLATTRGVALAASRNLNAVFSYSGTTTAPSEVKMTIMAYITDHPNTVRVRGNATADISDYRGSGGDSVIGVTA